MEQAEGISVEELQYRMLSKGDSADDYHAHLQKMKIKLLDWQTKYVCDSFSITFSMICFFHFLKFSFLDVSE